jgi:hypothetical protein
MFRIDPGTLYTKADLEAALSEFGGNVDVWLARVRPAKRFARAWFGEDLLEAIRRTPPLSERKTRGDLPAPSNRGGRRRADPDGLEPLRRLKAELREERLDR